MFFALVAFFAFTLKVNAMSYEQARDQALFLTDKMAYELNLTEDQYEAAYEINLDYLLSVNNQDDLYGLYWERRNLDLSYILLDWQYQNYLAASYFYRPLYWDAGYWHFGIYRIYPHRSYFFFGRPDFYWSYRGGHSWHMNGGRSWYHGREWGHAHHAGTNHHGFGMRNGYDRGDWNNRSGNYVRREGGRGLERSHQDLSHGRGGSRSGDVGTRGGSGRVENGGRGSFGGNRNNRNNNDMYGRGSRQGSDNGTVRQSESGGNSRGNFGGSHRSAQRGSVNQRSGGQVERQHSNGSSYGTRPSSTRSTVAPSVRQSSGSRNGGYSVPNRTFAPQRNSSSSSSVQRSSSAPSRSVSTPSRSVSAPSRSSSSGSSHGGFSGGSHGGGSHSSGSHGGGSHGGGSHGGGFGGHR